MNYNYSAVSDKKNFFGNTSPVKLAEEFETPLYVYNENILRKRCNDLKNLVSYKNFVVNYSPKANGSLELLKIIRDEGLRVDAMSPGEIFVNLMAGYKPQEILYISNNVGEDEFLYAINAGVKVSVDSISQLKKYGRLNPGGEVTFRLNPGIGAGHHEKVKTAGDKTKFGIEIKYVPEVKKLLKEFNLKLIGINQHIGSLFLDGEAYLKSTENILKVAKEFEDLEFIDLGGGFGIPYKKYENEARLNLEEMGKKLSETIQNWVNEYGKEIEFKIEPGRYIVAESSILLGRVHSIKHNYNLKYVGTDIGFNVLIRPAMYNSHHDIEIYRSDSIISEKEEAVRIVGNICETGDIVAKDRRLPEIFENDVLGILDSGAYAFSMSSNYNSRLRPAEVLVEKNGNYRLIRRRDSLEDLVRNFV